MKNKNEQDYNENEMTTSRKLNLNQLLKVWWIEKQKKEKLKSE